MTISSSKLLELRKEGLGLEMLKLPKGFSSMKSGLKM